MFSSVPPNVATINTAFLTGLFCASISLCNAHSNFVLATRRPGSGPPPLPPQPTALPLCPNIITNF